MARTTGGDLIVQAVNDVADLRKEYGEFSAEMRTTNMQFQARIQAQLARFADEMTTFGENLTQIITTNQRKVDGHLVSLGNALRALAEQGKQTRERLDEHEARLDKLEEAQ